MQIMNWVEVIKHAVIHTGRPAVWIDNGLDLQYPKEQAIWQFVMDSMKTLYGDQTTEYFNVMTALVNGGLFFFDSEEERDRFYHVFDQPLTDSSGMYACTFNSDGTVLTENT